MKACKPAFLRGTVFILIVCWGWLPSAQESAPPAWERYDETSELEQQSGHDNPRMRFLLLNSRFLDKNALWGPITDQLADFSPARYESLKPLILEQEIPALQQSVREGRLSYEELVKFYLYRIRLFESDNSRSLNALIALNPEAIEIARGKDRTAAAGLEIDGNSLFGIPVLLKDNVGTDSMPTTAGARILQNNRVEDAFVARRLKAHGAIILGKTNLSEWAYYFCDGCPLGYSAMGGQTLNPYGRKLFETGGSSSGSAVAVAANYAPVAVGSETSGSILSPASLNSTVGFKPTTGMLSRTGVVPISSSLDTLGPIARSVTDAVILFNAMTGYDREDVAMPLLSVDARLSLEGSALAGRRIGFFAGLEEEPLFAQALERLRAGGAEVVAVELPEFELPDFGEFLGAEMRFDLAAYLAEVADETIEVASVEDIVRFNNADPGNRAPYGQGRFDAMTAMSHSRQQVTEMLQAIRSSGQGILGGLLADQELDALLSLNNRHASLAAAANFPAMTIPLGIRDSGEPLGLTLIAPSFGEQILVDIGLAYEGLHRGRVVPSDYQ